MQPVDSKNCTALCLDSSPLILVVSPHPQGEREGGRERQSFLPLQIHVSASKCGGPTGWRGGLVTGRSLVLNPRTLLGGLRSNLNSCYGAFEQGTLHPSMQPPPHPSSFRGTQVWVPLRFSLHACKLDLDGCAFFLKAKPTSTKLVV